MNKEKVLKLNSSLKKLLHKNCGFKEILGLKLVYIQSTSIVYNFTCEQNKNYFVKILLHKSEADIDRLKLICVLMKILLKETSVNVPEIIYYDSKKWKIDRQTANGIVIYKKIQGEPLDEVWERLSIKEKQSIAKQIGTCLKEIHSVDITKVHKEANLVGLEPNKWNDIQIKKIQEGLGIIKKEKTMDIELVKKAVKHITKSKEEWELTGKERVLHNDLWAGNILVIKIDNVWKISGIIDWSEAIFGDPIFDLTYYDKTLFYDEKEPIEIFNKSYGINFESKSIQFKRQIFTIMQTIYNAAFGYLHQNPSEEGFRQMENNLKKNMNL